MYDIVTVTTAVVLCADHGQNLGESNMWSMMNLLETSLRVPLVIRPAPRSMLEAPSTVPPSLTPRVAWDPVELIDLFPTTAVLAGLPVPPTAWALDGRDLSGMLRGGAAAAAAAKPIDDAPAAFGQITRCRNCTRSYIHAEPAQLAGCALDARSDANWTVPCCFTDKALFDWMGVTVRTAEWRLTAWCGWNGAALTVRWENCSGIELFDHRADTALYDVDNFEVENVADDPSNARVREELFARLQQNFMSSDKPPLATTAFNHGF